MNSNKLTELRSGNGTAHQEEEGSQVLAFKPAGHAILWRVWVILRTCYGRKASAAGQKACTQGESEPSVPAAVGDHHGFLKDVLTYMERADGQFCILVEVADVASQADSCPHHNMSPQLPLHTVTFFGKHT